jgi:hypothetical protein
MSSVVVLAQGDAGLGGLITFFSTLMPFWRIKILPCACLIRALSWMELAFSSLNFIIKSTSKALAEV